MATDSSAPYGTALVTSGVWFDGPVQFRSGGSVAFNGGSTLPTLSSTPSTPVGSSVLYSTNGGVLAAISPTGQVTTIGGVTQAQSTTVTVANTAAVTALQSYTVPAGDPVAGAIYNLYGYGIYSDTGTPTLAFTAYWGGVAGTSLTTFTSAALGSGVTNVPFVYEVAINFRTATSAVANINMNLGTTAAGASSNYVITSTAPVTVTSNVASAMTVGVTWSAASASNTISLLGGWVERIA